MACNDKGEDMIVLGPEEQREVAGPRGAAEAVADPEPAAADPEQAAADPDHAAAHLQRLRDRVLIVIGTGPAVERLAQRRLAAGGRLCVIEANPSKHLVEVELEGGSPLDVWQPPCGHSGGGSGSKRSALTALLGAYAAEPDLKKGPDITTLADDAELSILRWQGHAIGVRMVSGQGTVTCEMSGYVVVHPSGAAADAADVSVQDLNAMPLWYYDRWRVASSLGVLFLTMTACYTLIAAFEKEASPGAWPWWRLPFMMLGGFAGFLVCGEGYSIDFTGSAPTPHFAAITGITVVFVSGLTTLLGCSFFLSTLLGTLPTTMLPQYTYFRTRSQFPQRVWKFQYQFGNDIANMTLGLYILDFAIQLGYSALLAAGYGGLASLFLPSATSLIEMASLWALEAMYRKRVVKARERNPGCVAGDTSTKALFVSTCIYGMADCSRLASIVAGTARNPYDYTWCLSLALCLVSNVMNRTGWSLWLGSWITKSLGLRPWVGNVLTLSLRDIKVTCGYPRFFPLAMFLCTNLIVNKGSHGLLSQMSLLASAMVPAAEILEDLITYHCPRPPLRDIHFEPYYKFSNYDWRQRFVIYEKQHDAGSPGVHVSCDPAGQPLCSLHMHGARPLKYTYTFGMMFVLFIFTVASFELLLGSGFLSGRCPRPVASMSDAIIEGFIVDTPYACH